MFCAFFLSIINFRFQLFFDTAPLTELPEFQITVTLKNLSDFSQCFLVDFCHFLSNLCGHFFWGTFVYSFMVYFLGYFLGNNFLVNFLAIFWMFFVVWLFCAISLKCFLIIFSQLFLWFELEHSFGHPLLKAVVECKLC